MFDACENHVCENYVLPVHNLMRELGGGGGVGLRGLIQAS